MIDFKDKAASLVSLAKNRTKKQPVSEEQELRRLDRISLMELIVDQRKKIEELEAQLEEANRRLDARSVRLDVENIGDKRDLSRTLRTVLREVEGGFGTD
jgi:small-conductance mechanosensitive channel